MGERGTMRTVWAVKSFPDEPGCVFLRRCFRPVFPAPWQDRDANIDENIEVAQALESPRLCQER